MVYKLLQTIILCGLARKAARMTKISAARTLLFASYVICVAVFSRCSSYHKQQNRSGDYHSLCTL
jgi:hypothetical protein